MLIQCNIDELRTSSVEKFEMAYVWIIICHDEKGKERKINVWTILK